MVFTCVVKGCDTVARNGLHSFPSNKLTAERWIIAIKAFYLMDRLNNNKLSHSYYKLCKKHFQESDFQLNGKGQRIVKPDSIPSLFLPNEIDVSCCKIILIGIFFYFFLTSNCKGKRSSRSTPCAKTSKETATCFFEILREFMLFMP